MVAGAKAERKPRPGAGFGSDKDDIVTRSSVCLFGVWECMAWIAAGVLGHETLRT